MTNLFFRQNNPPEDTRIVMTERGKITYRTASDIFFTTGGIVTFMGGLLHLLYALDGPDKYHGAQKFIEAIYDETTSCGDAYPDVVSNGTYTTNFLCDDGDVQPQFSTMAGQCYDVIKNYCEEMADRDSHISKVPDLYIAGASFLFVALALRVAIYKCRSTSELQEGLVAADALSDDVELDGGNREMDPLESSSSARDLEEGGVVEVTSPRM